MFIITGASRGIGNFLLKSLIEKGEEVIGIYNSTMPETGTEHYYHADLTNGEAVNAFIKNYEPRLKNISLINAAGISYNSFAHKADMDNWRQVIDVNFVAAFNMIRLLLPFMRNDNYGRIINFSSVVAQQGVLGTSAYAASKSALWGLCKSLAAENAGKNITANNINLGYFNIGMIEQVPENMLQTIIEKIPAKRLGEPAEILSTVQYIVNTPYLNGTCIDLNGGLL